MKTVRLMYRNHLLPPLTLPIQNLPAFTRKFYPQIIQQLRYSPEAQSNRRKSQLRSQMQTINASLLQKMNDLREKVIVPLKQCPWYYEQVEKLVEQRANTKKWKEFGYQYVLRNISGRDKVICYKRFKNAYKIFKKNSNPELFSQVELLQPLIFTKFSDIAQNDRKIPQLLNQQQKIKYIYEFDRKINAYNNQLNILAEKTKTTRKEIFEAYANQLEINQTSGLHNFLFK